MAKFLNYTTTVNVEKTLMEIQKILVAHKASSIITNYEDGGQPSSMSFMVETQYGRIPFRLPASVKAVRKVMEKERLPGRNKPGQPERVAWRVIKSWIQAQMALIEAGMASMEEVFLPYMVTTGEKTLFQEMVDRQFLLGEGKR